jgi:polysaccharide biosynthesis/export protein
VRLFAGLLCCCLLASGCAPGHGLPDLPPSAPHAYRLGPGDVVRVITFGEDATTGDFRVNDSGALALPLIGTIQATGLTTDSLSTRIGETLQRANLIKTPSVVAEVVAYRPIFVLGEVSKPGGSMPISPA